MQERWNCMKRWLLFANTVLIPITSWIFDFVHGNEYAKIVSLNKQLNGLLEEGAYVIRGEKYNQYVILNKSLNG